MPQVWVAEADEQRKQEEGQEEGFHPAQHFNFEPQGLSDEEQRVLDGDRYELDAGDAELVAEEDVW